MKLFFIGDLVEENGKTIRQNNLAKAHGIPVGTLVEVKFDSWQGYGMCLKVHARLKVTSHYRDCDGTPLYSVGVFRAHQEFFGFTEDQLTRVSVTPELLAGDGALTWGE
jgi:hypothetical protein